MEPKPRRASMASADPDKMCHQCAHYFITHDVTFPYACRALNFRSRTLPCREVLAASGQECQYFEAKQRTMRGGTR